MFCTATRLDIIDPLRSGFAANGSDESVLRVSWDHTLSACRASKTQFAYRNPFCPATILGNVYLTFAQLP